MERKNAAAVILSDREIREEASGRIASMHPAERKALEDEINAYFDTMLFAREKGFDNLTEEEKKQYLTVTGKNSLRAVPDPLLAGIERNLKVTLGVDRKEIAAMKRNPFLKRFLLWLGGTLLIAAVGGFLFSLLEKAAGKKLALTILIILTAGGMVLSGGILALKTAGELLTIFRFRKLQRAYRSGTYQEHLIEAEVYNTLSSQIRKDRGITD